MSTSPNPQPTNSLRTGRDNTLPLCYDFSVGHGLFEQGNAPIPHGNGAVAQLGERFNGIEEVEGSNPSSSTRNAEKPPKSRRLFLIQPPSKSIANSIPIPSGR